MKPRKRPKRSKLIERPFCVLLAEDDVEMRKLISWSLENKGYGVVECPDGTTLMRKLGLLGPDTTLRPYDLVISDIRMPGVTGLQVLESAREIPDFPPMILITAFPDAESREQAQRLGAAAMIAKPFEMDELLGEVRTIAQPDTIERDRPGVWFESGNEPSFPLEITFRHESGSEPAKDYIRSVAKKLDAFADQVTGAKIIIDESDRQHHKKHRYTITLVLMTAGKSIVVKHNTDGGATNDNLYMGINMAFGSAFRRLSHYLKKRRGHQKHGPGKNAIRDMEDMEIDGLSEPGFRRHDLN